MEMKNGRESLWKNGGGRREKKIKGWQNSIHSGMEIWDKLQGSNEWQI